MTCVQNLNPQVAQDVFADVENPTADELKALPQGKKTNTHRSCLHDDISVVIIVFSSEEAMRGRYASMRPPVYFRFVKRSARWLARWLAGWLPACLPACLLVCLPRGYLRVSVLTFGSVAAGAVAAVAGGRPLSTAMKVQQGLVLASPDKADVPQSKAARVTIVCGLLSA